MTKSKSAGFTLIELMIAVAIVGILTAVIYPSYTDYVRRTNRTEAMNDLTRIANLQEQFFADNRSYAASLTALGLASDPFITPKGYYSIAISASTARTFTLTATAKGTQTKDDCTTMSIDQSGAKTGTVADCWR